MTDLQRRMIEALIDTCERTTDLENVYNDKTNEHFSWEELKAELRK